MRTKSPSRFTCLCLALLLALFLSSGGPAAALTKICTSDRCCTQCDWLDANNDVVASIYWCWHNCPN